MPRSPLADHDQERQEEGEKDEGDLAACRPLLTDKEEGEEEEEEEDEDDEKLAQIGSRGLEKEE